ncbi:alpha/beta hydrolase [Tardiphaga sp.]|uniref:RBBP9/YdeN family alpha/beta hydrolase n=1 Tax=Tardiphaga sp. TaxID=1926292 RepID=UPI0026180BD7|nr:alpha/beta hydrolase [Tardiphaga sp.]MDB5617735.1 alpha/beta hydrolase family protein [Tardiphaga sp.]
MTPALIIPGLNGSPEGHWQSWLQESLPQARRVEQDDWDTPDLEAWLLRFALATVATPGAIIVAHSLGCILTAHAASRFSELPIRAALLVAPADVDSPAHTPELLRSFAPIPTARLPFPSIVVASVNDPFMTLVHARDLATAWGSDFVNAGTAGHINIASGYGPWPAVLDMFDGLTTAAERAWPQPFRRSG